MDLRHKHWALVTVGGLVLVFAIVAALYMFGGSSVVTRTSDTASTTPLTTNTGTSTLSTTAHIQQNSTYYDIDMTYPSSVPLVGAAANNKTVALLKAAMQSEVNQFLKDGNFASITPKDAQDIGLSEYRKEALSSEFTIYSSKNTLSYVFLLYQDTLGAHPNTYYKAFTFDVRSGNVISLQDLFAPGTDYPTLLKNKARADLPKVIAAKSKDMVNSDMISDGTAFTKDTLPTFYVDNTNLVLLFAPYEVGPYALGAVEDPIPLSFFNSSLSTLYK